MGFGRALAAAPPPPLSGAGGGAPAGGSGPPVVAAPPAKKPRLAANIIKALSDAKALKDAGCIDSPNFHKLRDQLLQGDLAKRAAVIASSCRPSCGQIRNSRARA